MPTIPFVTDANIDQDICVSFKWGTNDQSGEEGWQLDTVNDRRDHVFAELEDHTVVPTVTFGRHEYVTASSRRLRHEAFARALEHDLTQHGHTAGTGICFDEVTAAYIALKCFSDIADTDSTGADRFASDLASTFCHAILEEEYTSSTGYTPSANALEYVAERSETIKHVMLSDYGYMDEMVDVDWTQFFYWAASAVQAGMDRVALIGACNLDTLHYNLKKLLETQRFPEEFHSWQVTFNYKNPNILKFVNGEDLYHEREREAQVDQFLEDLTGLLDDGGTTLETVAKHCSDNYFEDLDGIQEAWFLSDDDGDLMVDSDGWALALKASPDLATFVVDHLLSDAVDTYEVYMLSIECDYEFYYEGE